MKMAEILKAIWSRRTTVLGYIVTILGVLATSSKFEPETVEWFVLIIGIVTAVLGHGNNAANKARAAKVVAYEEEEQ